MMLHIEVQWMFTCTYESYCIYSIWCDVYMYVITDLCVSYSIWLIAFISLCEYRDDAFIECWIYKYDCMIDNHIIDVVNNMNDIIASATKYINDMMWNIYLFIFIDIVYIKVTEWCSHCNCIDTMLIINRK
jgi:hypothetical protein